MRSGDNHHYGGTNRRHNNNNNSSGHHSNYHNNNNNYHNTANAAPQYDPNTPMEIPAQVHQFVIDLTAAVRGVRVHEIRQLYDTTFNQLTEQFFKIDKLSGVAMQHWPAVSAVAHHFEEDILMHFLYKELYYRYQYQLRDVTENIRVESWENYTQFFEYVLTRDINFDLPQSWLWDIMDEFIYHAITSCLSRKRDPRLWNPATVINILEGIVHRSNVCTLLSEISAGRLSASAITEYGPHHVVHMMGHNAAVMLLRVHTQLGDYYTALRVLEKCDIRLSTSNAMGDRSAVYNDVPACYMTLHYYAGFCCLMLRRYMDAHRLFTNSLRCKNYHIMSYQQQVITTLIRHAQCALSIVNMFCPQKFDITREDEWAANDADAFAAAFKKACPKYITPYDEDQSIDAPFKLMQSHCSFLHRELMQQECIPLLRSYLRLYDSIPLSKLAYLQTDANSNNVHAVLRNLLCWKHKAHQLTFTTTQYNRSLSSNSRRTERDGKMDTSTGHGLRGEFRPAMGGVDFIIDDECITVLRLENTDGALTSSGNANTVYHLLGENNIVKEMAKALGASTYPAAAAA